MALSLGLPKRISRILCSAIVGALLPLEAYATIPKGPQLQRDAVQPAASIKREQTPNNAQKRAKAIYLARKRSPYLGALLSKLEMLKDKANSSNFDVHQFTREFALQTLLNIPLQGPTILLTFSDLENTGDYVFVKKTYEILTKSIPKVKLAIIVESDDVAAKLLRIFGRPDVPVFSLTAKNVVAIKEIASKYFLRIDAPTSLLSGMDGGEAARRFLAEHKIDLGRDVVDISEYDILELPEDNLRKDDLQEASRRTSEAASAARAAAWSQTLNYDADEDLSSSSSVLHDDESEDEGSEDDGEGEGEHAIEDAGSMPKYQAGLQAGSYGIFKDQEIRDFTEAVLRSQNPETMRMNKLAEITHPGFKALVEASVDKSADYLTQYKPFFAHVREPESLAYFANLITSLQTAESTRSIDIFVTYQSSFLKVREYECTIEFDEQELVAKGFSTVQFVELKEGDGVVVTPLEDFDHPPGNKVLRIIQLNMTHDDVKRLIMASEPIQAATGDQSISEITSRVDSIPLYEAQDHKFAFADALLERIYKVDPVLSAIWNRGFVMYEELALAADPNRGVQKRHEVSRQVAGLLKADQGLRQLAGSMHSLMHRGTSFNESYLAIVKKEILLKLLEHKIVSCQDDVQRRAMQTFFNRLESFEIANIRLSNRAQFERLIDTLIDLEREFPLAGYLKHAAVYDAKRLDQIFHNAFHSPSQWQRAVSN